MNDYDMFFVDGMVINCFYCFIMRIKVNCFFFENLYGRIYVINFDSSFFWCDVIK